MLTNIVATMPLQSKRTHLQGLDGLRFLSALSVFGVHFNQIVRLDLILGPFDLYRLLANGEHAVALFIILSGFLLSIPFWQALEQKEPLPNFGHYALKRIGRIVPAYYVALILLLSISNLWHIPGVWFDLFLHTTFLFNFTEFTIMSINPPFWTLAVEMQFYMLVPVLFLLFQKLTGRQRLFLFICLAVAGYCLHYFVNTSMTSLVGWPPDPSLIWIRPYGAVLSQSPLALFPHFLAGLVAGKLFLSLQNFKTEEPQKLQIASELVFWSSCICVFILLSTRAGDLLQFPYGRYGVPAVMLLLTMLVLATPLTRVSRHALDRAPFRSLGMLSYGFYIYHYPILHWCDRMVSRYGIDAVDQWLLFCILSLVASILAASLSYFFIERPVLVFIRKKINK